MRAIYITVTWGPGMVLFADRQKQLIQTNGVVSEEDLAIGAATRLRHNIAEKAAQSHFGAPADQVESELFFEIFADNDPKSKPIFRSKNAPRGK